MVVSRSPVPPRACKAHTHPKRPPPPRVIPPPPPRIVSVTWPYVCALSQAWDIGHSLTESWRLKAAESHRRRCEVRVRWAESRLGGLYQPCRIRSKPCQNAENAMQFAETSSQTDENGLRSAAKQPNHNAPVHCLHLCLPY